MYQSCSAQVICTACITLPPIPLCLQYRRACTCVWLSGSLKGGSLVVHWSWHSRVSVLWVHCLGSAYRWEKAWIPLAPTLLGLHETCFSCYDCLCVWCGPALALWWFYMHALLHVGKFCTLCDTFPLKGFIYCITATKETAAFLIFVGLRRWAMLGHSWQITVKGVDCLLYMEFYFHPLR